MNDRVALASRPPLVFAGSPLDRADLLRRDEEAIAGLLHSGDGWWLILEAGDPLVQPNGSIFWFSQEEVAALGATGTPVFLGHYRDSACFAAELTGPARLPQGVARAEARQASMALPHDEAAIYALAKSLLAWHAAHRYCAGCGTPTEAQAGGYRQSCTGCGAEHFPQVSPVVIMLAVDGDRCLLGRQANWPADMWSALAGFVEPAETLEEACARELKEEAGVTADIAAIRYVMSQPWPFPASLMVGLVAPVTDTAVTVDTHELEQARWFSRDELRQMLDGGHPNAALPPSLAIARRLAELWADEAI